MTTAADRFTLLDDDRVTTIEVAVDGETVRLSPPAIRAALGWELKPEGLCRDGTCIPLRGASAGDVDLVALAAALDRPLAIDVAERTAVLGASAAARGARLASLDAPDFALPDLAGRTHRLTDYRGRKVLLLAWASWCGCRQDLPAWGAVHAELAPHGFTTITVALDQSADAARTWIDAADAPHPALIDSEHRVADLYRMVNVPTAVWIDEAGRIVRPNDAAFGNDQFVDLTGVPSAPHLDALRAWVRDGRQPFAADDEVRAHQVLPTADEQLARAEFALAWHLHRTGRPDAAERHFVRAGELAPHDWTIRRAAMPIRGQDPMGADFVPLFEEWLAAGRPYYPPMRG